jgi:biopolymer transport protein ExbD
MFFILTFNPAATEGEVSIRMPSPNPVTRPNTGETAATQPILKRAANETISAVVTVLGTDTGQIKDLALNETVVANLKGLEQSLQAALSDPDSRLEQVVVQVDAKLRYQELMQVVDICTRQKLHHGGLLSKLTFVELRPE